MKSLLLSLTLCLTALAVDKQTFSTLNRENALPQTVTWPVNDAGSPFGVTAAAEVSTAFVPALSGSLSLIEVPFARADWCPAKSTRTFTLDADAAGMIAEGAPGMVVGIGRHADKPTMYLADVREGKVLRRVTLPSGAEAGTRADTLYVNS
jgi:hypothetical protein